MLSDIIINISNGFEHYNEIERQVWVLNNYDAVVKFGINKYEQKVNYKNHTISLSVIPATILYNIPCLIGFKDKLDLKKLNNDINQLSSINVDIDKLLFIESLSLIEDTKICDLKLSRIHRFINSSFKIISLFEFTQKYNYICYLSSCGYFNSDGREYNNTQVSSRHIFSLIKPRSINNIIAYKDIIETMSCFNKDNDTDLYKVVEMNKNDSIISTKTIDTILLNYYWIDLDKLIQIINYLEVNILYLTGKKLVENAKTLSIIKDGCKLVFKDISKLFDYARATIKDETYLAEIYLI